MFSEISLEAGGIFRPNYNNGHVPLDKLSIGAAQLRHVLPAEWSGKTPVENQQNMLIALELGQRHLAAVVVDQ